MGFPSTPMTLLSIYSFPPQNAPEGGQGREEEGTEKTDGLTDFGLRRLRRQSCDHTRANRAFFARERWLELKNADNSQEGCENFQSRRSVMWNKQKMQNIPRVTHWISPAFTVTRQYASRVSARAVTSRAAWTDSFEADVSDFWLTILRICLWVS